MSTSQAPTQQADVPKLSVAKATDNLVRKVAKMNRAEKEVVEARREWREAVLFAHVAGEAAGGKDLSYPKIAVLSGKSTVRIAQVIHDEREARGIPTNRNNNHNPKEGSK